MIKNKSNSKGNLEQKRNNSIGQPKNNSQFPYNQYNSSAKKNCSNSAWNDSSTLKKFANFEDVKKAPEYNFSGNMDPQQTMNPYVMESGQKGDNLFGQSINQESTNSFQSMASQAARLQDLCPEDKKKIGELIKKLAQEKEEKDKLQQQLDENQRQFQLRLKQIYKQNEEIAQDSEQISKEFEGHIQQLKVIQQSNSLERSNTYQRNLLTQQNDEFSQNEQNINFNTLPNYNTSQSYNLASNYSSQFQNIQDDKENSNQFNLSQPSLSQNNESSINNTSQKENKKAFPLPKPPQTSIQGNNANRKLQEEQLQNERVVSQPKAQSNSSQNEKQSNKKQNNFQNSSESSDEEEDELEIAKKWRTLKKSKENSLNGSFTGVRESGVKEKQNESLPPVQKIERLQSLTNKSPSDKKSQNEDDLNNKIEEKAKNINSLDVDEIKQLNSYLLQKLKQLNQQESHKETPKFQSNSSINQQIQYSEYVTQRNNIKSPPKYQFKEENEEESDEEQETKYNQKQQNKLVKNETKIQRLQNNKADQNENKQSYDHYESKYQKLKQQQTKGLRQYSSDEEENGDDSSEYQTYKQKQIQNNKQPPPQNNQKQIQNNLFNQKNKKLDYESSQSDLSGKKNQNDQRSEDEYEQQGREENHQVDYSDNSLMYTINHKNTNQNNNTFLSGLSTPFPEKMSVEPDFLQSLKNYKMAFNSEQEDSYIKTNTQKLKNKIPQSPSSQKNQRQNKRQNTHQRSASKDVKQEITEAIEEIDEDEAREIMIEILNQKKKLNHSRNSQQSESRQHSRQSSTSKARRQDTRNKNLQKRGEFSDYEDDQYDHEEQYQQELQHKKTLMQQKIDSQINSMMGNTSLQYSQSIPNQSVQISQLQNYSIQNQSIQKKTKVDQEDVNLISLLNDDDGDDNLLDLVQKIEEDELIKKISRGNYTSSNSTNQQFKQHQMNSYENNNYNNNNNNRNNRLLKNPYLY